MLIRYAPFFIREQKKMTSEVIIDVKPKEISIALLEDKRLVEYQNEPRSANFSVGNIYIAKVKKAHAWAQRLLRRRGL